MFLRNRIRMFLDRRTKAFRSIGFHAFYVALDAADLAELRGLGGRERRLDFVFDNAGERWRGADYLYIEDAWETLHRLMTWHPPDGPIDWSRGEAPLGWLVAGGSWLVGRKKIECGGTMGGGVAGEDSPDGEAVQIVEVGPTGRTYSLGLIDPDQLRALVAALPDVTYRQFQTGYQAHCKTREHYGPVDCARCHALYGRLCAFLARHAGTGKSVIVAIEE